ncbi:MAG: hypothetical protein AB8G26_00660 [Ilumatobacter sp.]
MDDAGTNPPSDSTLPPPHADQIDDTTADVERSERARPSWAPFTLAAFVALVICTNVAAFAWPKLIESDSPQPELLLLLSSRNRWLVLALGSDVSLPAYFVIGFLRVGLAFLVCHLIGRAYADTAIGWFKKYLGFNDEAEASFDRGFEKAEWALIPIFAGSNVVGVLTGVRHTPWKKLVVLLSIGIFGRLLLMLWLERAFESQVESFIDFTTSNQRWFIIGSVALVVLVNLKNFRRR